MAKKGREFEILVSQLERILAHEGVEVRSPEHFFYEDGKQKAEVDITLRSNIGSVKILIGYECRLRPSDGRQGTAWIRDVASKKTLIGAHHMVAVSGTGFTDSAIRSAEELDVGLRVVESTKELEIKGWFRTMTFAHSQPYWERNGNLQLVSSTRSLHRKFDLESALFGVDDRFMTLDEVIRRRIDNIHTVPTSIPPNKRIPLILDLIEVRTLMLHGKNYQVDSLAVPIVTWREVQTERMLLNYYKNPKERNLVRFVGSCEMNVPDNPFRFTVVGTENTSKPGSRTLKWQFFTLDNEPHKGIEGTLQLINIKDL